MYGPVGGWYSTVHTVISSSVRISEYNIVFAARSLASVCSGQLVLRMKMKKKKGGGTLISPRLSVAQPSHFTIVSRVGFRIWWSLPISHGIGGAAALVSNIAYHSFAFRSRQTLYKSIRKPSVDYWKIVSLQHYPRPALQRRIVLS